MPNHICKVEPYTLRKKDTSKHLFLVLQLVTNRGLYSVPIWKDQVDPNMPVMVLPDTIWSFRVLHRVLYLWQAEAPKVGSRDDFFS